MKKNNHQKYPEINLSKVKTYSVSSRRSKVETSFEGKPVKAGMSMRDFLDSLPGILKADDLKKVAKSIIRAKETGKPVIAMLGGHVIKCGCSPILADLAESGFITHFASNGSAAIHDTELSMFGKTSEDVEKQLEDGSFGMAGETADIVNAAAKEAQKSQKGFGQTLGKDLADKNYSHIDRALLVRAYKIGIPYTLHVGLGTDIVHQHPGADGAAIGDASMRDFRIFAHTVSQLGDGGVVINFGSAVIMPEVFLKALSAARNIHGGIKNFTTANFDMIQHYRPGVNVVKRPVAPGGNGYSITGHHEIMIPLLAAAVKEYSV